jgi:hypothetical protein
MKGMVDEKYFGKKLCSACGPTHFIDGKPIEGIGKWHGKFERVFHPKGTMEMNRQGNLVPKTPPKDKE